jgi:uncharacterized protein (TIGR00661 family)
MRILYAVQGTGNGHLSRALEVIPCLQQLGEVDILVSGTQGDLQLPFPVTYSLKGLSFIFGKAGGVDLWKTLRKAKLGVLGKTINQLPVEKYDLVINDFEPVSAWACHLKNLPCIALSHQAAVISPKAPGSDQTEALGRLILNHYAPATERYGFHFQAYDKHIFTPVIRRSVRELEVRNKGHYTVYLPAYDDARLIRHLSVFRDIEWEVFSKHNRKPYSVQNVRLQPVDGDKFIASMACSAGVLCGAGFETPAEALYLGKKLMVIPMKNQYEQHLNAAALSEMGVPVLKSLKAKHQQKIFDWIYDGTTIAVDYPDRTQEIVNLVASRHAPLAATANP